MKKIAILGAGISGLSLGWFLKKRFGRNVHISIYEATERCGGLIQTVQKNGFLFECGPRGVRSSGKGKTTLQLATDLGLEKDLIVANKGAKKRYLYTDGKLQRISSLFLLKHGGFSALLKDLRTKKTIADDETIASFVLRHFNRKILDYVFDPIALGIFAGDVEKLSLCHCLPHLWQLEKTYGSIFKGFFLSQKKMAGAQLFSFRKGMQTIVDALVNQLEVDFFLSIPIKSLTSIKADIIFSTTSDEALSTLLVPSLPIVSKKTIASVSLGWRKRLLPLSGYGVLIPSKEKAEILGVVFDSEIFKEQQKESETRLCVMIKDEVCHERLLGKAERALNTLFKVSEPADTFHIHVAFGGIAQYAVGHESHLKEVMQALPKNVFALGRCFYGVGVNDCIDSAEKLASSIIL